jgi:hypothetical protein
LVKGFTLIWGVNSRSEIAMLINPVFIFNFNI